ncbi:MAG: UDP-4-amino-4,6-dideoxy-N-acetyl-beta-L-altrosamine transaminase [Coriobacteriia bacterium]|nr:UDP-4-amino-4,6-dideoxy-N-acetyl-beta-L-altrosamine transaminase [Coriobacteriia bacterium]
MIPYSTQSISEEDIQAVVQQLRSAWLTQGPTVDLFEEALASYCGSRFAVAVSSGTAALHLSMVALGVGHNSLVWTTPNSFVASANCARYTGADVDFVDIDPATYNLSVAQLKQKLEAAERARRLPDVVIPVHHSGLSCDMAAIAQLAQKYGFKVVEDASHALGGSYHDVKVGSCAYSDLTVLSFHPVKNITTGEGGAVLTNDEKLAEHLRRLRSHGVTRDLNSMKYPDGTPWHYEQTELGFNYRITDIQCALGLSQLTRLDAWVAQRNELAKRYDGCFIDTPYQFQQGDPQCLSARHLYVLRVPEGRRDEIGKALRAEDILVNLHYEPIHLQPYYRRLGFKPGDFPEAEAYGNDALSIPLFPALSSEQQNLVISRLTRFFV